MSDSEKLLGKLREFLVAEWTRKDNRQLVAVDLFFAPGHGHRDENVRAWLRADSPEFFAELTNVEKLIEQIFETAERETAAKPMGKYRFVVRTLQHLGGRASMSFALSPTGADNGDRRHFSNAETSELHRMIDSMSDAIGPLVAAHTASEASHADKLTSQVELVRKMLVLVQPLVRVLGTRPKLSVSETDHADRIETFADWRGLVLTWPAKKIRPSHDEPGPSDLTTARDLTSCGPGYSKGTFVGSHVFLREDGVLVEHAYEGSWATMLGHPNHWRAVEREISVEAFCRDWFAAADPKKLAEQLLSFIELAGDRKKATAKASDLAIKYRAILSLL